MKELPTAYNPKLVEEHIYKLWQDAGYFNPDKQNIRKGVKSFSIVIPPPNVTGSLHMGHALNNTLQDVLIRRARMKGMKTLWVPGTDHAGIATQNVVEKMLKKEHKSRHDLGREQFVEKVWEWKQKYGGIIISQLKQLGCSCDWSRERFTMDEEYSKAVQFAFKHYYDKGLIYQGTRVINWCVRCQTSISDLEVEHVEEKAKLYYFRYDQNFPITIATTRPETKLGDTAVAVNLSDKRYKKYIGKTYQVNFAGRKLSIKIIADRSIDAKFGTGALGVTPAHSLVDAELAEKNSLPQIQVINEFGKMTENAGSDYQNLKVLEAREKIVKYLNDHKLLQKTAEITHNLSVCERCHRTLEPLPSKQWFLKMKELAKPAIKAIKDNKIKFYPNRWRKVSLDWLENIHDWCISRQLWWGHRLPVYQRVIPNFQFPISNKNSKLKVNNIMGFAEKVVPQVHAGKTKTYRLRDHPFKIGEIVAFQNSANDEIFGFGKITEVNKTIIKNINLKDKKHGTTYKKIDELISALKIHYPNKNITSNSTIWVYTYKFTPALKNDIYVGNKPPKGYIQETDVLDTWFSSALWPFATLGWPKKTKDLAEFFPTNILSTARDIIYLWVARMIFSSLEFTGKIPFSEVYIHPTVFNREGKRMSKSLGTGVDPLILMDKYGTDATRFGLAFQDTGTQDMKFSEEAILAGKKFANKIWNAARFVMMNLEDFDIKKSPDMPEEKTKNDKILLAKLDKLTKSINANLDKFRFGQAVHDLYDFFWHDLCDQYLEESKKQLETANLKTNTQYILLYILVINLKLLHPFMPFITEEIYQNLKNLFDDKNDIYFRKSLIISDWPTSDCEK